MNLFFDGMEKLYSFDGIKSEGDFASGFASQSLSLTWGTGPRVLGDFGFSAYFFLALRAGKNKPKILTCFA